MNNQLNLENLKKIELELIPEFQTGIQNYELESKIKLYAPNDYWEASETTRKEICNGCGAKDGIKVPNTFYGLCIKEACNIHDWMYHTGKTKADKLFADAMFRLNLTILIDTEMDNTFIKKMINKTLIPFRHSRAAKYYFAVVKWGEKAYWTTKMNTLNLEEINKLKKDLNITFKGRFESI
jgi:hypothetical protein